MREGGREALLKSNEKGVEGKRPDGRTAMIFAPRRRSSADRSATTASAFPDAMDFDEEDTSWLIRFTCL